MYTQVESRAELRQWTKTLRKLQNMEAVQTVRAMYNPDGKKDIPRMVAEQKKQKEIQQQDTTELAPDQVTESPSKKLKVSSLAQDTTNSPQPQPEDKEEEAEHDTGSEKGSEDEEEEKVEETGQQEDPPPDNESPNAMITCDPKDRMFGIVLGADSERNIKTLEWIPCTYVPNELRAPGLPKVILDPFLLRIGKVSKANYPSGYLKKDVMTILNYYAKEQTDKMVLKKSIVTRLVQAWQIGAKQESNSHATMEDNLTAMVATIQNSAKATDSQAVEILLGYCEIIKQVIEFHEGTNHDEISINPANKPIPLHLTYLRAMYDTTSVIRLKPTNTTEPTNKTTAKTGTKSRSKKNP